MAIFPEEGRQNLTQADDIQGLKPGIHRQTVTQSRTQHRIAIGLYGLLQTGFEMVAEWCAESLKSFRMCVDIEAFSRQDTHQVEEIQAVCISDMESHGNLPQTE